MQGRTFFRIMLDNLFVNNVFCKSISALINFCNEQSIYNQSKLKFLKKLPLENIKQKELYKNRFIFNTDNTSGVKYN